MTDIIKEHFKNISNKEISYDGQNFYLYNTLIYDSNININKNIEVDQDEINKQFHINYFTFRKLFELMVKIKNPTIIETGSSAWGVNSSELFDKYIDIYGGNFSTVDINPETTKKVQQKFISKFSHAYTDDSINFIRNWNGAAIDIAYLDSYDIDYINYQPSAYHGKREFEELLPKLNNKSLVLIDDTPSIPDYMLIRNRDFDIIKNRFFEEGVMPGKGMWVENILKDNKDILRYNKVLHQYQVLFEIEKI